MQKKKNKIRVVYHPQKYIKPLPNCPHCHKGFLEMREYVEVATEERDEERSWVGYCPRCEWIISEDEAQQCLHPTRGRRLS